MSGVQKRNNIVGLPGVLRDAEQGRYAVGSFSPRYTVLIGSVLEAAEQESSPVIVQVSQKELDRYAIQPAEFAREFYRCVRAIPVSIPAVLHLDHTWEMEVIREAIEAGFTSVMIDASAHEIEQNIAISRRVAEYAHDHGVSVEAELGTIGTTDSVETDTDEELFTDPQDAERFVRETGVDALAVSCGTAHGVYMVRSPRIELARLQAIRSLVTAHLVLHGGSGIPSGMMREAIQLRNGGVSKVNIATDLELAFLGAVGRGERLTNAEARELGGYALRNGRAAVVATVRDKIRNFLGSANKAPFDEPGSMEE